jgi:hypothetical protein
MMGNVGSNINVWVSKGLPGNVTHVNLNLCNLHSIRDTIWPGNISSL